WKPRRRSGVQLDSEQFRSAPRSRPPCGRLEVWSSDSAGRVSERKFHQSLSGTSAGALGHRRGHGECLDNSPVKGKEECMQQNTYLRGMTRRGFVVSLGPGIYVLGMAVAHGAPLKKVPTSTGIDALFVPFVVAAELKIFEKYGLETSYKPFDDGNV